MLSQQTLGGIACPVLNYHAGITPKYRGMNGGYWALATGDAENFGATVHLVDAGVDTGDVLYQARGTARTGRQSRHLRAAPGGHVARHLHPRGRDALAGRLTPDHDRTCRRRQWYHPTLWFYLWTGMTKGVW